MFCCCFYLFRSSWQIERKKQKQLQARGAKARAPNSIIREDARQSWKDVSVLLGPINREYKKLRRQLQGKRHIKIELCDYAMLITLYKMGGVHFRLLGADFHVKAKNERFTPASSRCRQNLEYENFTSSFGRLRQNVAPKSVPYVQHDYFFHSTNQIIDLWRCR